MSGPVEAGIPPAKLVMQLINGKCLSGCVSLAAELGIADLLADGPRDVATLAQATGTCSDALYRVLRTLTAVGVFEEMPDRHRHFQNNPVSAVLISGVEPSVRQYARWYGRELHWRIYSGLETTVRTGRPWAVNEYPGKTPFHVLAEHPSDQEVFNRAMTEISESEGPAIAQAYDFGRYQTIIDIGGGQGSLARCIAAKAPQSRITVFDLPHVIDGARGRLSGGPSAQLSFHGGSFFDALPGPVDLCVLKHIIHDWDDEAALRILANCRDILNPVGRVLVCEMLIEPGPEELSALALDIEMLVGAGGRERTKTEFSELFTAAGLRLEQVIRTATPVRLLEAVRAN